MAGRATAALPEPSLGAVYLGGGWCRFRVWAPRAERVEVHLVAPEERLFPLLPEARGYHAAVVEGVEPGSRYLLRLDGRLERPDPASRFQPEGVHGPSQVVDPAAYTWGDTGWTGLPLSDYVFYELHVGTFTPEGTLSAAARRLGELSELGVTAVELMPVAQFPGGRNWGYDGVFPYAVQDTYGGPDALKAFVDRCHRHGLAAVLDVVYNHLGPEGNVLADFGPYFTDRYKTPWGPALNFDGPDSDEVRRYFLENALRWLAEFHFDALRLDAVHGIFDLSARPFLQELSEAVDDLAHRLGRRLYLIAESDRNDPRTVMPRQQGGLGLHAQWCDDFHHALHGLLTREEGGYYADYGAPEQLATAFRQGYVFTGQYSRYRRRRHGSPPAAITPWQLVVFAQNHDQVGNRAEGERLTALASPAGLRVAAAAVLLAPYLPLLFMGEEYGETAPFLYFTSHSDAHLIEAVRRGRREEFAAFAWKEEPPDPQDPATFRRSGLRWEPAALQPWQRALREYYRELIALRKELAAWLGEAVEEREAAVAGENVVAVWRGRAPRRALLLLNLGAGDSEVQLEPRAGGGPSGGWWRKRLDSSDPRWGDPVPSPSLPEWYQPEGRGSLRLPALTAALYLAEAGAPRNP